MALDLNFNVLSAHSHVNKTGFVAIVSKLLFVFIGKRKSIIIIKKATDEAEEARMKNEL